MIYTEWIPINAYGLIWERRCGKRILGRIIFYTTRGAKRAEWWLSQRARDKRPRSCYSLREAINWVELESPEEN